MWLHIQSPIVYQIYQLYQLFVEPRSMQLGYVWKVIKTITSVLNIKGWIESPSSSGWIPFYPCWIPIYSWWIPSSPWWIPSSPWWIPIYPLMDPHLPGGSPSSPWWISIFPLMDIPIYHPPCHLKVPYLPEKLRSEPPPSLRSPSVEFCLWSRK